MEFSTVLAAWAAPNIIDALIWAAFGVINLWIWQKNKALGNLLMLCGAGAIVLGRLAFAFSTIPDQFMVGWVPLFGAAAILVGFFFLSKPLVEAQMAAIKKKMQAFKEAGGAEGGEGEGEAKGGDAS